MRAGIVLLTGFEPFGDRTENASELAARALDGRVVAGRTIVGRVLPVSFAGATPALRALLRDVDPELVICTGEADRPAVCVERIAINVADARIRDNAGAQPIDEPIEPDGPAARWSTLPLKPIVAAIAARGVAVAVSETAGTFVCNHVFYGLMHALAQRPGVRGGFVHVPTQMAHADIVTALEAAIAAA
jgi:pyroglutamyl-peptidase